MMGIAIFTVLGAVEVAMTLGVLNSDLLSIQQIIFGLLWIVVAKILWDVIRMTCEACEGDETS